MLKQEIHKIECVQRRFTKKLHGLHKMTYSDRLISLGIESLYCRRVKADLLMCYNILTNRVCLASSDFFTLSVNTYTRGNSMRLSKTQCIRLPNTLSLAKPHTVSSSILFRLQLVIVMLFTNVS